MFRAPQLHITYLTDGNCTYSYHACRQSSKNFYFRSIKSNSVIPLFRNSVFCILPTPLNFCQKQAQGIVITIAITAVIPYRRLANISEAFANIPEAFDLLTGHTAGPPEAICGRSSPARCRMKPLIIYARAAEILDLAVLADTALLFWLNHSPSPFSTRSPTASFRWLTALYYELRFHWLLLPVLKNNLRTRLSFVIL